MNTALPDQKTTCRSRTGLLFHEILADGLIHAASVFGIEQDERFVERVTNLAWTNGVQAIENNVPRAAELAKRLGEELEVGRSQTGALCRDVAAAVKDQENPFDAIRDHYESTRGTRQLDVTNPSDTFAIRQHIGEAVLGGLYSRGLAPDLFQTLSAFNARAQLEQRFLGLMLSQWIYGNGLPTCHPFLQMAESYYRKRPNENKLVCELLGVTLRRALDEEDVWSLDYWLKAGWATGVVQAKFAPDSVQVLFEEAPPQNMNFNRTLFSDCLVATAESPNEPDLAAAFEKHLPESVDAFLLIPAVRACNPRLLAARAFDFTVWMGFIAEMPAEFGGKRGAA